MFITTVRVRRARSATLISAGVGKPANGDLLELMVLGEPRAIVHVPPTGDPAVLWAQDPWKDDPQSVTQAVSSALAAMQPVAPAQAAA